MVYVSHVPGVGVTDGAAGDGRGVSMVWVSSKGGDDAARLTEGRLDAQAVISRASTIKSG